MPPLGKLLGIMKPVGGGDPIPLRREEMLIGRRPTSDIQLDFENVSGKHCVLRLIKSVWHIRDLNSKNGTTVNGLRISNEHGLMPDDQLGIATHLFTIDYDPVAPVLSTNQLLEDEGGVTEKRKSRSLMELAGLESERESDRPSKRPASNRPSRPDDLAAFIPGKEADFDDVVPDRFDADALPLVNASDDDFFAMIEEDVKKAKDD